MNVKANARGAGALTRPHILLSALVVALSLSFTRPASAHTAFQASINGVNASSPSAKPPCPTLSDFCGTASIAGYGPATLTIYVLGAVPTSGPCPYGPPGLMSAFTYTATTTFTLSDGSRLALHERGLVCTPGNSGSVPPQSFVYGLPLYADDSSWTVDSALTTGQFSGLTGTGTDAVRAIGARISGTYSGTLNASS